MKVPFDKIEVHRVRVKHKQSFLLPLALLDSLGKEGRGGSLGRKAGYQITRLGLVSMIHWDVAILLLYCWYGWNLAL